MKRVFLALIVLGLSDACALARDTRADAQFYDSLKKLDPTTRLDEVCDYEAMMRIDRDPNHFHPDRAKAEVLSTPQRTADSLTTSGGAFRSEGRWYALSYTCKTTPDHLKVTSFAYHVGKLIPASEWPKYGLWR
jgi:Domain of Unknown Function (DUF930)